MRIFLDAYFDNNFGDDLFADLLLKHYPDAMFYTFWKKAPISVLERAERFKHLVILSEDCILQESWPFDGYVMIGGDVLPDGVDYTKRIAGMRQVKANGGFVAMLGFSLYQKYGEKTMEDLKTMSELADSIVIRDHMSAERFRRLVPGAKVTEAADMVFTADYGKRSYGKENVLGMIPRRKLYSTEEEHLAYCRGQAAIAVEYLKKNPNARVRFLAFSTGEYDDRVTAADIVEQMKHMEAAAAAGRTEIVAYEGDIEAFLEQIGSCSAMVPTRFHGVVFALLLRLPFVPVPYEVKVTQLLEELEYQGICIPYGEELSQDLVQQVVQQVIDGLEKPAISEERLAAYEQKAKGFFEETDVWYNRLQAGARRQQKKFPEILCGVREEREKLYLENQMHQQQIEELNKWISALQEQREAFERQNQELEAIRKQQTEELQKQAEQLQQLSAWELDKQQIQEQQKWIESLKQERAAFEAQNQELLKWAESLKEERAAAEGQNQELLKWIESLKQERAAFERQNLELEEIRKWQLEQLMKRPYKFRELEKEYSSFLQTLRQKLDKQSEL